MTRASGQGLTDICSTTGLQASGEGQRPDTERHRDRQRHRVRDERLSGKEGQREEERASGQRGTYEERYSERDSES